MNVIPLTETALVRTIQSTANLRNTLFPRYTLSSRRTYACRVPSPWLLSSLDCNLAQEQHVHKAGMADLHLPGAFLLTRCKEIETWVAALALYDKNNLEASIVAFRPLADTSKVLFNCGLMCATLGAHKNAVCVCHSYKDATLRTTD